MRSLVTTVDTIHKVYKFLGVNSDFTSSYVHNKWTPATNFPPGTSHLINKIFYLGWPALITRKTMRRLGFDNVNIYCSFSPPPLEVSLRKELTAEFFDNDIELLIELTGVAFSSWISDSM